MRRTHDRICFVPMRAWVLAAAVSGAMLLVSVGSASGAAAPPTLRACTAERDDGRRLACYDREMARLEQSYGLTQGQIRELKSPKAPEASATRELAPPFPVSEVRRRSNCAQTDAT